MCMPITAGLYRCALTLFLEGLPALRQKAIAMQQATLPATATVSERLVALARSCPVLHKLGQTLARDRNLSVELRRYLQQLESLPPSIPLEALDSVLTQELGSAGSPWGDASASCAGRSKCCRRDSLFTLPVGQAPLDGVFKVLKPGIRRTSRRRARCCWSRWDRFWTRDAMICRIPHLDYRESFAAGPGQAPVRSPAWR